MECPICLSNKTNLITDCNHSFCKECWKRLECDSLDRLKNYVNCPLCRKKQYNDYHFKIRYLYNYVKNMYLVIDECMMELIDINIDD